MANKSFVVQYLIKARDAYSAKAEKIARSVNKIDRANEKASRSSKKLTFNLAKAGKGLKFAARHLARAAKVILSAALAAGAATLFAGSRFEDAIADLSSITGATGKDLDFLKRKSLELAKITITNQAGIAQAMKLVASAKPDLLKDLPALVKTTEQVILLKNAGTELDIAVAAVAGGLNTFGRESEFAAKFVNILAAGSKFGSSEINNTAEAVKIAGPGARAAGLSFLQLNAAIQTVAKGSIFGSQAGTALSAIFGRLRRQGIDFQKTGLEGSFELIRKRLESIKNPTLRAITEAKIFGEEHSKVGLAILNNVKLLGRFERELAGTSVAEDQAAIRLRTFSKQIEKLKILLQDKLIKLFERIRPLLVENAEKLGQWFDSIDEESIKRFAASLLEVLKLIIQIGKGLGKVGTFLFGDSDVDKASKILKARGVSAAERVQLRASSLFGGSKERISTLAAEFNSQPVFKAVNGTQTNNVNVGVNVGLDQGLKQTSPAVINRSERRTDVGLNAL